MIEPPINRLAYSDLEPGGLFTIIESAAPLISTDVIQTISGEDVDGIGEIDTERQVETYGAVDTRKHGKPFRTVTKSWPFVIADCLCCGLREPIDMRIHTLVEVPIDYALAMIQPSEENRAFMNAVVDGAKFAKKERAAKRAAMQKEMDAKAAVEEVEKADKAAKWKWGNIGFRMKGMG